MRTGLYYAIIIAIAALAMPAKAQEETQKNKIKKREFDRDFSFCEGQLLYIDIGMNNYLEDGRFPDENNALYSVKPFGSWYVGINLAHATPISNKMFIQWGAGVSWYNFKFDNKSTQLIEANGEATFVEAPLDLNYSKSKLTASYLNMTMVPMFSLNDVTTRGHILRAADSDGLRIGIGVYAGYRLGSHTKQVYEENGDKEKDKDRNNFYLENWRHGIRLQVGYDHTLFFVNYDLNPLFTSGPKLNAFSFGVTLM